MRHATCVAILLFCWLHVFTDGFVVVHAGDALVQVGANASGRLEECAPVCLARAAGTLPWSAAGTRHAEMVSLTFKKLRIWNSCVAVFMCATGALILGITGATSVAASCPGQMPP